MYKLLILSLLSSFIFSAELTSVQNAGGVIDESNAQAIIDEEFQAGMKITAEDMNAKLKALNVLAQSLAQPSEPEQPQLTLVGGNAPTGYSGDYADDYTSHFSTLNSGSDYNSASGIYEIEIVTGIGGGSQSYNVNRVDIYFLVNQIPLSGNVILSTASGSTSPSFNVSVPVDSLDVQVGDVIRLQFDVSGTTFNPTTYLEANVPSSSGLQIIGESGSAGDELMGLEEGSSKTALGSGFSIIMQIFQ